jgi:hypothetical protein
MVVVGEQETNLLRVCNKGLSESLLLVDSSVLGHFEAILCAR